jgi:integrase
MRETVSITKVKHPRYKVIVSYPDILPDGTSKRRKSYFSTREGANSFAAERRAEIASHGAKHAHVTDDERASLIRFRTWNESRQSPISLSTLINEAIAARDSSTVTCTVQQLIDARINQAQRKQSSKRHLDDLTHRLDRFATTFGKRNAGDVEPSQIEQWLHGLALSPISFANFKRAINSVFSFAVKQGRLPSNPVTRVEAPKITHSAPAILTPGQVHAVLSAATPRLRVLLVLQAFAGVRRAEAERLSWAHIHLDTASPCIELPSEVTKTNRRRSVELSPNAVAWLKPLATSSGAPLGLSATIYRSELGKAAKVAEIQWEENLLRHSYGSYRLAQIKNAAQVAEEMGNSPQVVRTHYQNLVRPESVALYWKITPKRISEKVLAFPAKAKRRAS